MFIQTTKHTRKPIDRGIGPNPKKVCGGPKNRKHVTPLNTVFYIVFCWADLSRTWYEDSCGDTFQRKMWPSSAEDANVAEEPVPSTQRTLVTESLWVVRDVLVMASEPSCATSHTTTSPAHHNTEVIISHSETGCVAVTSANELLIYLPLRHLQV